MKSKKVAALASALLITVSATAAVSAVGLGKSGHYTRLTCYYGQINPQSERYEEDLGGDEYTYVGYRSKEYMKDGIIYVSFRQVTDKSADEYMKQTYGGNCDYYDVLEAKFYAEDGDPIYPDMMFRLDSERADGYNYLRILGDTRSYDGKIYRSGGDTVIETNRATRFILARIQGKGVDIEPAPISPPVDPDPISKPSRVEPDTSEHIEVSYPDEPSANSDVPEKSDMEKSDEVSDEYENSEPEETDSSETSSTHSSEISDESSGNAGQDSTVSNSGQEGTVSEASQDSEAGGNGEDSKASFPNESSGTVQPSEKGISTGDSPAAAVVFAAAGAAAVITAFAATRKRKAK